ncbi:MAG: DUF2306 domain-containing protein [Bacteroidia bacterium]
MFDGKPRVIAGFEIPFDDTLFLIILGIHVASGLTCVISGIFSMISKKREGIHIKAGKIYYWAFLVLFITSILIAIERWKEDYHLLILGSISFIAASAGKIAAKRKWSNWILYHITGMALSYIFLLIAFYVDNGKFLPVWKHLPQVLYWLLPLIIGIPLLAITLIKNPLSGHYFKKQ